MVNGARTARGAVWGAAGLRNLRMMYLLQHIAREFNKAGVPLMVLKGGALNLVLYDRPDCRPMDDLDLMVRPEHIEEARVILERLGGLRGAPQVREDFFPRFHYEAEYTIGAIYPVKIDLHVRPFRPMRYAATVPRDAMWDGARNVVFGDARVFVPSAEDMLIHMAVHLAVHNEPRPKWVEDVRLWIGTHGATLKWDEVVARARAWRLGLPLRRGFELLEQEHSAVIPAGVLAGLNEVPASLCDRMALWQAPRDAGHPARHVAANLLCTPSWSLRLSYFLAILFPGRAYMRDWYCHRHPGWLLCAHVLRWFAPLVARLPRRLSLGSKTDLRPSRIHGVGVFATKELHEGEAIAWYHGKRVDRDGMYVVRQTLSGGETVRVELTGKLKFLNHSCRPNGVLRGHALVARRVIPPGEEITIDYGRGACTCPKDGDVESAVAPSRRIAQVA